MERVTTSTQEQHRFVEEQERFGAKVREVFKSEPTPEPTPSPTPQPTPEASAGKAEPTPESTPEPTPEPTESLITNN